MCKMTSKQGKNIAEIIYKSAAEVATPTLVSTLSICTVFAPILLMEGATKYLFIPLAMSVIFSMIGSYMLSNTLVPVLVDKLLKEKEILKEDSLLYKVNNFINVNIGNCLSYNVYLVEIVFNFIYHIILLGT